MCWLLMLYVIHLYVMMPFTTSELTVKFNDDKSFNIMGNKF